MVETVLAEAEASEADAIEAEVALLERPVVVVVRVALTLLALALLARWMRLTSGGGLMETLRADDADDASESVRVARLNGSKRDEDPSSLLPVPVVRGIGWDGCATRGGAKSNPKSSSWCSAAALAMVVRGRCCDPCGGGGGCCHCCGTCCCRC